MRISDISTLWLRKRPSPRIVTTVVLLAVALTITAAPAALAGVDVGEPAPWTTVSGSSCVTIANCVFFQSGDNGTNSYTIPSSGIVTSYTLTAGSSFPGINAVGLRIFRPMAGGVWLLAAASASDTELPPIGGVRNAIATRVPVQAGDHLGIAVEFNGDTAWQWTTTNSTDIVQKITVPISSVGSTVTSGDLATSAFARLNVTAHVEPDADADGYGDDSQDACPLDPARQTMPCTPPAVTGLKVVPKVMRVNPKGKILKNASRGGLIAFKLSQPGQIQFVVSRVNSGRRSGRNCVRPNARNRTHKRCHYFSPGHNFSFKSLPAGAQKIDYSGRYKHGHGSAVLKPGRYLLTAVPGNTGGTGAVAKARFRVVK